MERTRATRTIGKPTHPAGVKRSPKKSSGPPLAMPAELYQAIEQPEIVTVPGRAVVALAGQGAPDGQPFQACIQALYGTAYTLKFSRKAAGKGEFKIGPLEAAWWTDDPNKALPEVARERWHWDLRLGVPPDVTDEELASVVQLATTKKGKLQGSCEAKWVRVAHLPAQRFGRILHVGPYADEGRSIDRLASLLVEHGLTPARRHTEVYLSDPRRAAPARLKTVLLLEIA